MDNNPLEILNLSSITGITLATMFLTNIVKKTLFRVAWLKKIPVFVYAGMISMILAIIANKMLFTNDGSPLLAGRLGNVIWAALISALGSSGFYTWLRNPEPIQTASGPDKGDVFVTPKLLLIASLLLVGGCQNPEKAILRESMDQGTRTIRRDHKAWAEKLVVDPTIGQNRSSELPKLSANDLKAINLAHQEYENLVTKDRAGDDGK